jgi:polar amino acid transport system permease protein
MQNQTKSPRQNISSTTGNRRWRNLLRSPFFDILQFVFLLTLSAWFLSTTLRESGYHWQWYQIPQYLFLLDDNGFHAGPLLLGLLITIKISAVSLIFASTIGMATAMMQLSNSFVARTTAKIYVETIRNTPLLIQLFFIYFVLGPVLGLSRFPSAVLALSLFEGAYASEIIRSGIVSIHRGQWEASYSLGMSNIDTYLTVILPQAIRRILPPLTSQAISLIKDSALVSTIAIYDLTMQAQAIIAETYLTFEIWFTVALMYLAVTLTLSLVVRQMEHRFRMN